MDNGQAWFSAKRYGFGSGLPISWQGWAVTILYLAVVLGSAILFDDRWRPLSATVIPATLMFMLVCARTTRGGWRWRWGNED